jgi:hypothetical protein
MSDWILPDFLSRVRRNHALEHATMHVLSEHQQDVKLVGRSSLWGFYVYGPTPTEDLLNAAKEGLRRLKAGQHQMAVHPNCGTNFAVAGTLAGVGAFLALGGLSPKQPKNRWAGFLERIALLPFAIAVATLGVMLAQPLGAVFQARVTTQADVGDLRIVSITREDRAGIPVHLVRTDG